MTRRRITAAVILIGLGLSGLMAVRYYTGKIPPNPSLSSQPETGNKSPANTGTPKTNQPGKLSQTFVNPKYANETSLNAAAIANRVVLKLSPGTDLEKLAKNINAEIVRKGPLQFVTLALPAQESDPLIKQIGKMPGVLSVQPVQILKTTAAKIMSVSPTDNLYPQQWGLNKIEAQKAWNLGFAGSGIVVAVVDTGVDLTHPDLKDNILPGYNALTGVASAAAAQDGNGHGTHVSGIIAAEDNGVGIVGVAYQAKILPVKALTRQGAGTDDCVADGITWAADQGAKIINLSLGSNTESEILQEAIQYASSKGCLIVAAAGNQEDNLTTITYPAADPNVLAVTASDTNDQIASFSLPGPQAALAAPGVGIISDYWGNSSGYASLDGTSMASPFVTGSAALLWGAHPELNAQQVKTILENSARDLGASGRDNYYGYGRLDAYWALRFAASPQALTSPASLDWAGGTVQAGDASTSANLSVPARAFGLDPGLSASVSLTPSTNPSDLPAGILPCGDAFSVQWNGSLNKFLGLTISASGNPPDSNHLGYIFHWTGTRWILTGGGVNASTIKTDITEPGVYRAGYSPAPPKQRLAGNDRIATAVQISQAQFPDGAEAVILATADDFADALSGVPLAYKVHAPILLTGSVQLPAAVFTEIQRLAPEKIYLLGGTGVISAGIEQQLQAGFTTQRLAGANRFGTAAQIASALGTLGKAVIVNGTSYPDAISIASAAAQQGMPILLTAADSLPSETDTSLRQLLVAETIVAGGDGVVSPSLFTSLPSPTRLAGQTRYDTAAAILQAFPPQGNPVFIATGEDYPDALAGGTIAALNRTDIVLIPPTGPSSSELSVLKAWPGSHTLYILGGEAPVPDAAVQPLTGIIH